MPVKSTSDLMLVQSNLYGVRHGSLVMSADRPDGSTPLIKLGREFTSVEDYLRRIPHGVPTITQLDHLTVAGDVMFGEDVTLKVRLRFAFAFALRCVELPCVASALPSFRPSSSLLQQ